MGSFFQTILLVVYMLVLASVSKAQLISGDAVGFPGGNCVIGNTTLAELGISQFNTNIAPEPLTWTIGTQATSDKANNQSFYDRDYFLGTPPSLQLANLSSVRSCALFFEGISSSLQFPTNVSREYAVGTCSDALGISCVSDLISQFRDEIKTLFTAPGQNWTESTICTALETKLQNNAPESCHIAHSQRWGTILVRALTGPEAAPTSPQTNCHPTSGKDYNVSLVSSVRVVAPLNRFSDQLASFMLGITPVMTIFYPYSHSTNSSIDEFETYLNCMKIVGSTAGEVGGTYGSSGAVSERSSGSITAIAATMFVTVLLL